MTAAEATRSTSKLPDTPTFSTDVVADALGVSTRSILKWVKEGSFPEPIRLGPKTFRWPRDVIEKILARE
jgi:predicted DNA-binding transcriptional regulator AlpA